MNRYFKIAVGAVTALALSISTALAVVTYFPNTTFAIDMHMAFCDLASSGTHYFVVTDGTNVFCDPPSGGTPFSYGPIISRTITLGSAIQCTDPTAACVVSVNLSLPGSVSLTGGTTSGADCVIGSTSGVGTSGGTIWSSNGSGLSGSGLIVGLAVNITQKQACRLDIGAGEYLAVRVTAGTPTIISAFERKVI